MNRQWQRAQVLKGMTETMVGGYRAITKVDGWGEVPKRDDLPKYNKIFCRNMAAAFNVEVVAVEPLPDTHGLWAANHISWMDIPVLGSVVPAFFLSKAEVEAMPAFGRLARACGSLFIKRGSGDSGKVADQIAEFLTKGYSILFYPEGTTTDGTNIKKIYGKLLQAAMDANKPIQPLVLCYVNAKGELDDKVPFVGKTSFTKSFLNVMDSDPVTAYILPLEQIDTLNKTRDELTIELHESMQKGLQELHNRVLTKK
ncbi:lysophospholipid acyltransferase family protein [Psychrobacter sp.]|uniref:lysophospholipid acyltransferase family protein n=1 Tax=Psychrobacter sp. TaxID=56811 RepID=UPI0025DF03DF|nr:lysophospholipid acyltransferase family protein [Psychrobacter sp.]